MINVWPLEPSVDFILCARYMMFEGLEALCINSITTGLLDASASKNCLRIHTCSLTHRHRHKKTRSERFIHHPGHHHHHIHLLFIIYMHIHCKKPLPLFSNTLMRCTFTCWATCPQSSFNSKSSHIFP